MTGFVNPGRLALALVALGACAHSRTFQPVASGPERFGAESVSANRDGAVTFALRDSAYVVGVLVEPDGVVWTFGPQGDAATPLQEGTYTFLIRRPPRVAVTQPLPEPCRRQPTAFYLFPFQRADLEAPQIPSGIEGQRVEFDRYCHVLPAGPWSYGEGGSGGRMFLLIADVPTSRDALSDGLVRVPAMQDSVLPALPEFARHIVGSRTQRWTAFSITMPR